MNIDMVTLSTLVPISQETNTSFNENNTMTYGVKCYEAGMIQVLKGIAEDFLDHTEICSSDFTRKLNKNVTEMRMELENTFNPRDFELIKKYESELVEADAADAYDHYIQGFLDGYRYLCNRVAYKGEGFNVSRFTTKDSEENE